MLISVIVNTKNEQKNLESCLRAVKSQNYPAEDTEIIIVDNFSTDQTKEIAEKFTEKIFDQGPERSSQKNFGVQKSRGEWFLHLDADMTLSENVLRECVEKISRHKDAVALYIPEIIRGEKFFSKVRRFERSFYNGTVIDGARFLKKSAFEKIGGFDEKLYACEDWDLDKRLKKIGNFDIIESPLYHNESEFCLRKYLAKKSYYSKNFNIYIEKWGENDPDIKKQFGFWYRFFGVFTENGKWKKLLRHPILTAGMYFLRFLVGAMYLMRNII